MYIYYQVILFDIILFDIYITQGDRRTTTMHYKNITLFILLGVKVSGMCVCVCVRERERERQTDRRTEGNELTRKSFS